MVKSKLLACAAICLMPAWLGAQTPPEAKPAPARTAPSKPAPSKPGPSKPAQPGMPAKDAAVTLEHGEGVPPEDVTKLVQAWLEAWNKLDGTEAATQKFLDLYAADAKHEVGVPGRPLGPEFFEAPNGLRRMAEDYGRLYADSAYRFETFTAAEQAADLIYYTEGPWGGPAVAVPYTGAYTVKDTKRRFFYAGVAVLHIKDGKIIYGRFYQNRDDISEVRP